MDVTPWLAQLRKGAAELVVLSVVSDGELYGLEILERANRAGEIVADGALYPLLSRLEKERKLSSRWDTTGGPHPRKYYQLTDHGRALLVPMVDGWTAFRTAMTGVVERDQ